MGDTLCFFLDERHQDEWVTLSIQKSDIRKYTGEWVTLSVLRRRIKADESVKTFEEECVYKQDPDMEEVWMSG